MLRTTAQHITKQIRALPKCLWPITHLTILLTILAVALCAGASALVIQHISNKPVPKTSSNPTSNSDGSLLCVYGQPDCPMPSNTSTPTQSTNTETSDKTQQNPTNTTATTSLPDQYGCTPQTSGYESCVTYAKKNEQYFKCSDMEKAAYDKYSAVGNKAWATRDAVLAEWNTVYERMVQQNYPLNAIKSEEERYKTMAYTDTNALIKPAYAEYVSTLNSIKSQGCEVTVLSDLYSWPGY